MNVTKFFFIFLFVCSSFILFAQGELTGVVLESTTRQPMEYVTVALYNSADSSLITGGITEQGGNFTINDIPFGSYYLKASFIGYKDKIRGEILIARNQKQINIGELLLEPDEQLLQEIDIVAEKPTTTYQIDKKVVNVEGMNTVASATAVEVLENIPSIRVDMDGNVSLRGATNFTLLIDGRPTTLPPSEALQLISANNIKDVEIITNPSAKYNAEGTGGIINVILKHNKLEGISTLVNVNGGSFNNYGADFLVSVNKKKIKFNIGGNYKNVNRYRTITQERKITSGENTSLVQSEGLHRFFRTNYGVNAALEYQPNESNSFLIGVNANQRQYNAAANYNFNEYQNNLFLTDYENKEHTLRTFLGGTISGDYRHLFHKNKKHFINFSVMYNTYNGNEEALTENYNSGLAGGRLTTEVGPSNLLRFNLDYEKPLSKERKLKMGARTDLGFNKDDQKSYQLNLNTGEYDLLPLFSTNVDYKQNVYAAYTIFSGKYKKKLGYQFGVRTEYTDRYIYSHTANSKSIIQRLNWFPSAHFSYKLNDKNQLKANVSRRIQRPRSWHLEPFIAWEDPYTVRQGNPNLQPEYIMVYEMGWIKELKKGSFATEIYYRNTINKIQRIQEPYDTNVIIKRPVNAGVSNAGGGEITYHRRWKKWWSFDLGSNAFYYQIKGKLQGENFYRESFSYNVRVANNFNFKKDWKVQLVTNYVSAQATAQGRNSAYYRFDFALKKDFWKNRMTSTLQFRNFLNTLKRETFIETTSLYSYRLAQPKYPFISLSIAFKLNNFSNKDKIKTIKGDEF